MPSSQWSDPAICQCHHHRSLTGAGGSLSLSPGDLRLWPQPTEAVTVQPQNNLADLTALLLLVVRHTGGPSKQIKMYEQDIFVGDVEFSWKFRQIVRKKESRVELSAKIMFTTDMPGIPDVSLT